MDFVITNPSKKVYIRLNNNGSPETCSRQSAQRFENSKAKNILDHLPRTLKKFHFRLEPILEPIFSRDNEEIIKSIKQNVIETIDYEVSENIFKWIDKFGSCSDVFEEAQNRVKVLIMELEKSDKELLDILHSIEMKPSKDLYGGWKLYKKIRENRKNRRSIKDEILIIQNVLEKIDFTCLNRDKIQKAINGLFDRKYTFRIVEEENSNDL